MRGHIPALDAGFYLAALAYVLVLLDLRPGKWTVWPSCSVSVVHARARMRRRPDQEPVGNVPNLADRGLPAIAVDTGLREG